MLGNTFGQIIGVALTRLQDDILIRVLNTVSAVVATERGSRPTGILLALREETKSRLVSHLMPSILSLGVKIT